jgi:fatty-acid peroxygenase
MALLADPYRFIMDRCASHRSDLFECRILGRRTLCLSGPGAAELFYNPHRFTRRGAAPEPLRATLFGKGAIQGLEGSEHQQRKQLLLSLTSGDRVRELGERVTTQLLAVAGKWTTQPTVELYEELHEPLFRAVCAWAGVPPLHEAEVQRRTREVVALFDRAGAPGAGHLQSRIARWQTEHWLAGLVNQTRAGDVDVSPESPLAILASYKDSHGRPLTARIAAVELLNLLRPTVAVSVFIVFAAHALLTAPRWRAKLADNRCEGAEALSFVQEVRRYYPFFPAVIARVRETFVWQGMRFSRGTRAMLDVYGTNHDARIWEDPQEFRPERFAERHPGEYEFIPQGGGNARLGHRCPGEAVTLELVQRSLRFLTGAINFELPSQDFSIDYARLPALPRDRMRLSSVRLRADIDHNAAHLQR